MTTTRRPTPARRFAALAIAALALALGLGAGLAAPAGAHEGDAVITVEAAHPAGTGVHYIVRVTWANDGHAAADATVTATAVGPDGSQLTPVTLAPADDDGRYAGIVEYPAPGAWTVRITSIDPTGTVEQAQEVSASPTTEPEAGGSDVTTGDAEDDGNGFAPAEDGTGASDDEAATSTSGSDDMPVYLVVAAAAVVIIGAVTAVNIIRRNRLDRPRADGTDASPVDGAAEDSAARAAAGATSDDPASGS